MHNSCDQKYYLVYRIARIALQKRYQDRVNQCVSKLPTQDSSYVSPAIPAIIAQMLGLKVDFASAKLSGMYIYVVHIVLLLCQLVTLASVKVWCD